MYVPTGAYYHVFLLRQLLGACDTWIQLVGDKDPLDQIGVHEEVWCDLGMPAAVCVREDGWQRLRRATGGLAFNVQGALEISIFARVPKEWTNKDNVTQLIQTRRDKLHWMEDVVGNIVLEMEALQNSDLPDECAIVGNISHLSFTGTATEDGPFVYDEAELPPIAGGDPYGDGTSEITAMKISVEVTS